MNKHRAFYVNGVTRTELKVGQVFGTNGWQFDGVTDDGEHIVTRSPEHNTTMMHKPGNIGCEIYKFVGTVDITPTWRAVLPILIEVATTATTIEARQTAMQELQRMADLADYYIETHKPPQVTN